MKKKLIILAGSLMTLAICATAYVSVSPKTEMSLLAQNIEALARGEGAYCHNGGVGSSGCSIDGGIEIMGVGVTAACSVSCNTGYYACCTLRCTCIRV